MGHRMEKGRQEGRLAGTPSTVRVPSVTPPVDSGALFGLNLPQQEDEQGLPRRLHGSYGHLRGLRAYQNGLDHL